MLSFDPAVQDCGEVSLSLSVSEPKSAADTFLLDMVVRDTAFSPILMPIWNHNKTRGGWVEVDLWLQNFCSVEERPGLIMLIGRNTVEVGHVERIEKRGGDLFLEKIDTFKVSYVATYLKMHAVKSYEQVHPKQNTRNAPGYIRKVDDRDPHATR